MHTRPAPASSPARGAARGQRGHGRAARQGHRGSAPSPPHHSLLRATAWRGRMDRQTDRAGTQVQKAALSNSFSPRKKLKHLLQPGPEALLEGGRRPRVAGSRPALRQAAVPTGRSPGRAGTFAFQVSAVPPVKAEGLLQDDSTLARLGARGSSLGPKVMGKSVPGCTALHRQLPPRCRQHARPLTATQGTWGGHMSMWQPQVAPGTCQLLQLCEAWSQRASGRTPPPHGEGKPRPGGIK